MSIAMVSNSPLTRRPSTSSSSLACTKYRYYPKKPSINGDHAKCYNKSYENSNTDDIYILQLEKKLCVRESLRQEVNSALGIMIKFESKAEVACNALHSKATHLASALLPDQKLATLEKPKVHFEQSVSGWQRFLSIGANSQV